MDIVGPADAAADLLLRCGGEQSSDRFTASLKPEDQAEEQGGRWYESIRPRDGFTTKYPYADNDGSRPSPG